MGCGESRASGLTLDNFKLAEEEPPKVDKESIKAVWAQKYPDEAYNLSDEELVSLVPPEPITEDNADEKFPEFKAKFEKLADIKRRLDNIKKNPKPYLDQYWKELASFSKNNMRKCINEAFGFFQCDFNIDKRVKTAHEEWYKSKGKALITKAFDHHDTNGDGALDKAEAAVFFAHCLEVQSRCVEEIVEPWLMFVATWTHENYEEHVSKQREALKKILEKCQADREVMDKKAFEVMDENKDGTLQLAEVLDAFDPFSKKHLLFWSCYGFTEQLLTQQHYEEFVDMKTVNKQVHANDTAAEEAPPVSQGA